jgi:hypothetical protein
MFTLLALALSLTSFSLVGRTALGYLRRQAS